MSPTPPRTGRPAYDPRRLREIFDRRAAAFDDVAFLPREIADRMRERLEYIKVAPARVLDAACGAGADLPRLRERFPEASVLGVDISAAMLARARTADAAEAENGAGWRRFLPTTLAKAFGARGPQLAQADFSALPFASSAFELLWSNLALHWHSRPDLVFPEWQRVLKVNGLLMFSTFGPDTLRELAAAYREAERTLGLAPMPHTIDFVDMHDLGDMLVESGFEIPVMDQEVLTITYRSPESLLADVARWGAYPFEREAASARADAQALRRHVREALEALRREDGTIPLTFEVIYGHAWKAVPRTTAEGHGIVRLEDIGRGPKRNR
ncbi:methyltransferase domain-containing protein [Caballeronia sp. LZ062]|uniref:methyltransferase domain-containing protein n=1 Tax=unclassified Caballeronia TaxID=2646786 RepID=UPI0028652C23|nr:MULTISPECIES: methyltransferase domain-containing protein [unclassified Caballeronia]MDR5853461.1 methyltransferase domain-containing protein [Caballeronia sp. LZ050]MDR5872005.1 methyltransferase domain-containing protein [Caballeronia sp. LZ062]